MQIQISAVRRRNSFPSWTSGRSSRFSKQNPKGTGGDQRKLEDAKETTRREQERFHNYESAEEVYNMFHDDLNSEPAKEFQKQLRQMNLPTLADFEKEFDQLADRLGVH